MTHHRLPTNVLLAIAGFTGAALAGLAAVQAQPSLDSSLNLDPDPTTFVPEGLGQARSPTEGGSRGVIGQRDDRVVMTSRSHPWSAIGRVDFQTADGSGHCSGTLVETDIVLTNAHCVVDPETHEFYSDIKFAPNVINGEILSQDDIANAVEVLPGTDFRDRPQPPHPDDWAFIKLDQPLGERYGTVAWKVLPLSVLLDNPEQYILVGYSGDFPADNPGMTASVHDGCSILGSAEDEFLRHNCDTFSGSSGGPILGFVEGEPAIVALNSAEFTAGEANAGVVNYAVDLSRLSAKLQDILAQ